MDSTIPRPGSSSARDALRSFPPLDLAVIDADTGQAREVLSDPDYQAIAALAECVKSNTHALLSKLDYNGQFYYPASLHLPSLLAARGVIQGALNKEGNAVSATNGAATPLNRRNPSHPGRPGVGQFH